MKIAALIFEGLWLLAISANISVSAATNAPAIDSGHPPADAIILPEPIPDPLERINRGLWAVNETAMKGVVKPSGKVYRMFVPPAIRIGLSNIGRNLAYPRRVVNNLLQQRWTGARDESYRFLCNSVLGLGGYLNVANEFHVPTSDADFGETFGKWGWNQNFYLMLPIAGPSSDRDAAGAVADWASNPLTYFSPYNYIPTGITYNNLTDAADGYVRQIKSQMDPYALLRDGAALLRKERAVDWKVQGAQHAPTLETMQFALFGAHDPDFPEHGRTRTVRIPGTGRDLPYTLWLQDKLAPIVYILPGIGAHRLNSGAFALAELLYEKGFSAVTISSAFNFEFIGSALTADLPGYAPSDVKDIHVALDAIDRQIQKEHPKHLGRRGLMGYSLGGFHTLLLAVNSGGNPSLVQFDRYFSIDAPVRLLHGVEELDSFYNAALEWPAAERTDRIEQLLLKIAELSRRTSSGESSLPLSAAESKFLIGLVFRLNLRDMIFFTQMRHNQGVLKQPLDPWKRQPVYREIMDYSFRDYMDKFIIPYYQKRGIDLSNEQTLSRVVDLHSFENDFKTQRAIHLVANEDDILLAPEDVRWLRETFAERATLFPQGGHLGNLNETPVQMVILNGLAGLQEEAAR